MSALAATSTATAQHSRLYWGIVDTLTIARRHLLHIPQQPEQWASATLQPIMFVVLFRYVFGGAIQIPGVSYVNYLMAGIFVQTIVVEGMTGGIGLALDLKEGIMDRLRALPMSPAAVLIGPTLTDLVRNVFIIVVMLAIGLAVGFRPDGGVLGVLAAVGVLLAVGFAVSWIGALLALVARDPEAVQMLGFVVLFPLTFASSAFVPVNTMPSWLQPFVRHQPVSVIVAAVRALLLDQPTGASV
jgi:ABC transporter DrrB family efflux protein